MMLKKNSLFWFIMFTLYITITNGQDVSKEASVDSTDQSMFILEQIYQEKNVICLETYLPPHNPFPSFADFHQAESRLSKSLDFFENILNQYIGSRYIKEIEKQCHKDNFSEWRKERSEVLLAWYQAVFSMLSPQFKSPPYKKYIYPDNNKYLPNIDSQKIVEPEIRKSYEEALWNNKISIIKSTAQKRLARIFRIHESKISFLTVSYKCQPRADEELINLLEKYNYPPKERINLLCELNIPYRGVRNWQSTDKLFKTNAKFISLENGDVTLERANGQCTTIEYSVLRKEDQDYVKEQLNPETKTPKNETTKD